LLVVVRRPDNDSGAERDDDDDLSRATNTPLTLSGFHAHRDPRGVE